MELKHFVFMFAVLVVVPIGASFAARRPWIKDALAFTLLLGTTRFDLQAINFLSREWYRGTTRGIELCWLDLVWMMILLAELRTRRPGAPGPRSPVLYAMLAFVAYNAFNVLASDPHLFGVFELTKMIRAVMVFVTVAYYVKSDHHLRVIAWALGAAIAYEWLAAAYMRFVHGHSRSEGTLDHANSLSMYNLIGVPVLLAIALSDTDPRLKRMATIGSLLGPISVLFTVSRNGLVTMGLLLFGVGVTCGSLKITAKKVGIAFGVIIVAAAVVAKTWSAFEARFASEGAIEKEYQGKIYEGRGVYLTLAKMIVKDHALGCGLNNWSYCVSAHYGPLVELYYVPYPGPDERPPDKIRIPAHSHIDDAHAPPGHSLYAITLGETGWPGVLLFGVVWVAWLVMAGSFLWKRSPSLRSRFGTGVFFGLCGAFAQSFTEWEYRQTPLLFLLHVLLGATAATYPVRPSLGLEGQPATRSK
ncbi:MAG: hypothetical protein U0359_01510 [Byssovorax sp.]